VIQDQSFLNDSGLVAYQTFSAIKRHFTSPSYDYFKYNGKIKVTQESFVSRRDSYQYQRLSRVDDFQNLILANIIENQKLWVGDLFEDRASEIYIRWKNRNDDITETIKADLDKFKDNFQSNFISDGHYPYIIDLYLSKQISLETLSVITKLTNSQVHWAENVLDKVVFPDIMKRIDKYYPFIVYSKEKSKKIIKERFF